MILHVDMDAFFASIEQAINPRLVGKPLIVGSRGKKMHTVVCAASYAAKALGIHSGMPSREAFSICP
ncbi:MAG TPA: DNA polymerase IV, partial [Candidatus Omnitrophota bacterium]|nr:DNA polymerase IV [Candidatus Omnitrophota bacterium]